MRLVNELRALADQQKLSESKDLNPSILILHADSQMLNSLSKALALHLANLYFHNAKSGPAPKHSFAHFSTLNAATGLEASIVFLLGIDSLLSKEASPQLATDERDDLITQNTRQLYMAFTRAAQKLIVFTKSQELLLYDEKFPTDSL